MGVETALWGRDHGHEVVTHAVAAPTSAAHHRHQQRVGLVVGGGQEPTTALTDRGTVDVGDNAAGSPAHGDTGREVHALREDAAIGDIRGAPTGSHLPKHE